MRDKSRFFVINFPTCRATKRGGSGIVLFLHVLDQIICTWEMFLTTLAEVTLPSVNNHAVTLQSVTGGVLARVELLAAEITLENLGLPVNLQVVFQEESLVENRMALWTFCLDVFLGARLVVSTGQLAICTTPVVADVREAVFYLGVVPPSQVHREAGVTENAGVLPLGTMDTFTKHLIWDFWGGSFGSFRFRSVG